MFFLGINHFLNPGFYDSMIPGVLPAPRALVYLSGLAEAVGAAGTMWRRTRRPAGWLLLVTLITIFPANLNMALNADAWPDVPGGRMTLLLRLPLQGVFLYWVWLATQREREATADRRMKAEARR